MGEFNGDFEEDEGPVSVPRCAPGDPRLRKIEKIRKKIPRMSSLPDDRTMVLDVVASYLGDRAFARRFVDCMDIMRTKNVDYSQGEDREDRIAAFRRIARDVNISMRQAWAVFAQKHWGAIMKFVKDGRVESEPIDGRINDLINYLVLLGAIKDDIAGIGTKQGVSE